MAKSRSLILVIIVITLACGVVSGVSTVTAVIVADTPCPIVGTIPALVVRGYGK